MTEAIEQPNLEKNQKARTKGKLKVLENTGSRHHKKKEKRLYKKNKRATRNQAI